jgi:metal-responsive CopG/Arc/MetJ family transcriptional regulator
MRMKTAISIPDEIFESAQQLASSLGISRSELYARAVTELLERHRADKVTERLDRVYGVEESAVDPLLANLQRRTLSKDKR